MQHIAENLSRLRDRIERACLRSGRSPREVDLLAVTKTVPVERIQEALALGLDRFGENYLQEALPKIRVLGSEIQWHFIGHLQSNKVKHAIGAFRMIQTVDRLSLAREIDRRAAGLEPVSILIQVNIALEATKSGVASDQLTALVQEVIGLPNLRLRGLMTMPPFFDDPERARPYFRALRELREGLRAQVHAPHSLDALSMGMTGDFEVAIEEGSTCVRIGTALFGQRPA
jgi:PLP dependent protein